MPWSEFLTYIAQFMIAMFVIIIFLAVLVGIVKAERKK